MPFSFDFLKDIGTYSDRVIGRDNVNGFTISTAFTSDEGYETAIIDKNNTHPVERYPDKEASIKGHKKWKKKMVNPPKKIKKLFWSDMSNYDEMIELEPMEDIE